MSPRSVDTSGITPLSAQTGPPQRGVKSSPDKSTAVPILPASNRVRPTILTPRPAQKGRRLGSLSFLAAALVVSSAAAQEWPRGFHRDEPGLAVDAALLITSSAWDGWSTERALERCASCSEGPSIFDLPRREHRIGVRIGVTGAIIALDWWLREHDRHRLARWLSWALSGLWFGAGVWNVSR